MCKGRDALSKQHGVLLVAKAGSNAMLATRAEGCHDSDWGIVTLGNVRNPTIPPLRMLSTSLYTREAHSYLPYRSISRIVIGNG